MSLPFGVRLGQGLDHFFGVFFCFTLSVEPCPPFFFQLPLSKPSHPFSVSSPPRDLPCGPQAESTRTSRAPCLPFSCPFTFQTRDSLLARWPEASTYCLPSQRSTMNSAQWVLLSTELKSLRGFFCLNMWASQICDPLPPRPQR